MDHALHGGAERDVRTESGSAATAFPYDVGNSVRLVAALAIIDGDSGPALCQ
jgi:hypothetical protein